MQRSRAFLLAVMLAACEPSAGPEEAVRQWLSEAREAAESRDRDRLVEMISENYADARGNDRADIDRLLRLYFLRNPELMLVSSIDQLELIDDTAATVSLTVGMAGTDAGALGVTADAYRFDLELEKRQDGWRLLGARWGELGQELH